MTMGSPCSRLWSPTTLPRDIDLFREEPFPFDEAYSRSVHADARLITVTVASIADLIALKQRAGPAKVSADSAHWRPGREDGDGE